MSNSRSHTLKDIVTVAAAGSNSQANSTVLARRPVTEIVTVSASSRGVRMPATQLPGVNMGMHNATAVNVKVYPATGDKIATGATNAAYTLSANTGKLFVKSANTPNLWLVR